MHPTTLLLSLLASLTLTLAHPQLNPQIVPFPTSTTTSQCTFTATPCAPFNGPTETITVYEQPFTATATKSFDCEGCGEVTVSSKNCGGVGIPIQTTTFVFVNGQSTTTVDVCSPTAK